MEYRSGSVISGLILQQKLHNEVKLRVQSYFCTLVIREPYIEALRIVVLFVLSLVIQRCVGHTDILIKALVILDEISMETAELRYSVFSYLIALAGFIVKQIYCQN